MAAPTGLMGFLSTGQACVYFIQCRMSPPAGVFFLQKCFWPELFAAVWLTHESVRWEQAEQATPPHTPSIRDSAGSLSRVHSVGFQSNSHIRTEEIPNFTKGWKLKTSSISKNKQTNTKWMIFCSSTNPPMCTRHRNKYPENVSCTAVLLYLQHHNCRRFS